MRFIPFVVAVLAVLLVSLEYSQARYFPRSFFKNLDDGLRNEPDKKMTDAR